jgi:hypothetical protein
VWCWPRNTGDSTLIRQVKTEMREWNLARIVWVADRGFASAQNRRFLQQGGGHYILGEKLRAGTTEADQALARQGRYAQVADNLQVKGVNIDATGAGHAADQIIVAGPKRQPSSLFCARLGRGPLAAPQNRITSAATSAGPMYLRGLPVRCGARAG